MTREYKIGKEFFRTYRRRAIMRMVPLTLLAVIGGLYISYANSPDDDSILSTLPLVLILASIAIFVGGMIGLKRTKAMLESYTVSFSDNMITREQLYTSSISIYFSEVKKIERTKKGQYLVYGRDAADVIGISPYIEGYDEVSEILAGIRAFETNVPKSLLDRYPVPTAVLMLGSMAYTFTGTNMVLLAVTGAIFLALSARSLYMIQTSKNVDVKTKRLSWFMILPMLSSVGRVFLLLLGYK